MDIEYKILSDDLWIEFTTNEKISSKSKTYKTSNESLISPVASKIFGFPWVDEVVVNEQSVLIKRQDWVDFEIIAEPLKSLLVEHFETANRTSEGHFEENPDPQPVLSSAPDENKDLTDEAKAVIEFLDSEVNPQVATHGGRIAFIKLDDGDLHVKMEGGCQGCGMAKVTLREGVETSLKENFDFIKSVTDVTDHDEGISPYISR